MTRVLAIAASLAAGLAQAGPPVAGAGLPPLEGDSKDGTIVACAYNGMPLAGRVRIVTAGSDFSVKIVKDEDPDLKVKRVYRPAELCGEWELVDSFPDFTIRIVDGMEDFTIELVEKEPGVPER